MCSSGLTPIFVNALLLCKKLIMLVHYNPLPYQSPPTNALEASGYFVNCHFCAAHEFVRSQLETPLPTCQSGSLREVLWAVTTDQSCERVLRSGLYFGWGSISQSYSSKAAFTNVTECELAHWKRCLELWPDRFVCCSKIIVCKVSRSFRGIGGRWLIRDRIILNMHDQFYL